MKRGEYVKINSITGQQNNKSETDRSMLSVESLSYPVMFSPSSPPFQYIFKATQSFLQLELSSAVRDEIHSHMLFLDCPQRKGRKLN